MKTAIVINSELFGKGDEQLGKKLMGAFLRKIWVGDNKPDAILFYNSGVKLISNESTVLDALDGLYSQGVDLIACGTCVDFYDLKNNLHIGRISDMVEISTIMMTYDKVITL